MRSAILQQSAAVEQKPIRLHFYSDPGHGWLAAPMEYLAFFGLREKVSGFSYIDSSTDIVYLEEDCDAALLVDAFKSRGVLFEVVEHVEPRNDSWVRSLPYVEPV